MARDSGASGLDQLSSINRDGSRKHPEPADVSGRFVTARRLVYAALIGWYLTLPFLTVGGYRAIHLDIPGRRFHLFGSLFNAQDGFRLLLLALTLAFGLLFVTALYGRVWCGWACPQSVFIEALYRPIERLIDGPREARLRLRQAPWGLVKILRWLVKHAAFLVVSLVIAHAFLALFVPLPSILGMIQRSPGENVTPFSWVMAVTAVLYFDGAWFREQFCVVLCPYGRLQSVLTDEHSVTIGYDALRGEPRGHRRRDEPRPLPVLNDVRTGDCVDCNRCVAVCPTGIDIRNGTQMECIGCAQCIDACDDVMRRLDQPKGLIRYDSLRGLTGRKAQRVRGRTILYGVILLLVSSTLVVTTWGRTTFEAQLLRSAGAPYRLEADQTVRNMFELHVVNKDAVPSRFTLSVEVPTDATVTLPVREVELQPLQDFRLPVVVSRPRSAMAAGGNVTMTVINGTTGRSRAVSARLLGPTP